MQTQIHYKTAGNSPCLQALTIYACSNGPPSPCVAQIWYDLGINRTLTCKLARVKPRFYFKSPWNIGIKQELKHTQLFIAVQCPTTTLVINMIRNPNMQISQI